jgi:hypothetical protein
VQDCSLHPTTFEVAWHSLHDWKGGCCGCVLGQGVEVWVGNGGEVESL